MSLNDMIQNSVKTIIRGINDHNTLNSDEENSKFINSLYGKFIIENIDVIEFMEVRGFFDFLNINGKPIIRLSNIANKYLETNNHLLCCDYLNRTK